MTVFKGLWDGVKCELQRLTYVWIWMLPVLELLLASLQQSL